MVWDPTTPHGPEVANGAQDLEVTVRADAERIVLEVTGEVDLRSVPTLAACLDHAATDTSDDVVVDLAAVTFLDSSGLAALVKAHNQLTGSRRSFGVQNPRPNVRRVLTISGVDSLIIDAFAS